MTGKQIQCLLGYLGYDFGSLDGQIGPKTKAALNNFRRDYGVGEEGLVAAVAGTLSKKRPIAAKTIWTQLMSALGNPYAVAGIMGNLQYESRLISTNLEDQYQSKLGYDDDGYTKAVDDGSYKNFVSDYAGYGIAQWTYHTRKALLLKHARDKGVSIGDLDMQISFLLIEFENFGLTSKLKTAASVRAASDLILTGYECPADQSEKVKQARAALGEQFYQEFVKTANIQAQESDSSFWKTIKYFKREEFRCPCGKCGGYPVEPKEKLVRTADMIREDLANPMTIVPLTGDPHAGGSGVRCTAYNATLKGSSPTSYHLKGQAMDFSIPKVSDTVIENYLNKKRNEGALKFYKIAPGSFHVQVEC